MIYKSVFKETGSFFWCTNCYTWTKVDAPGDKQNCRSCNIEYMLMAEAKEAKKPVYDCNMQLVKKEGGYLFYEGREPGTDRIMYAIIPKTLSRPTTGYYNKAFIEKIKGVKF